MPSTFYSPTIYTVDLTSANGTGSGDAGDLVYVIGLANANPDPAGSEIQFDPTVFGSPQTITLSSTLVLSETAGPEVIDGPGANLVTVSGNNGVEVFSVASGVTAQPLGPDHLGRLRLAMAAASTMRGTLTVTDSTVDNNSESIDNGGSPTFGGGIHNVGTMTVTDSTIDNNLAWVAAASSNDGTMTITDSTITATRPPGP